MIRNNGTCGIAAHALIMIFQFLINTSLHAAPPVDSTFTNPIALPDSAIPDLQPWNTPDSTTAPPLLQSDTINATPPTPVATASAHRYKKRSSTLFSPRESLYVGISPEQDYYARRYIQEIFAYSWGDALKTSKKLQHIEHKDQLPPLSALLMVSARVFRILHGEYETDQERKTLLREVDEISSKSMHQHYDYSPSDSMLPLTLFIDGGIRGLNAALKIEINVVAAAIDGFTALNSLERLLELSPRIDDAWLGYGLFYCSLARAPAIVRTALNISGRSITYEAGLDYLRRSAYHGRYTSELAKLYLIQFLSPYWGHLANEKKRIFKSLRKQYPDNPYYVFLAIDEDICFHPERIDSAYIAAIEETICSWRNGNFSLKRYNNLVRYQLGFLDTATTPGIDHPYPDTAFNLGEFAFYPQFLLALGEKRRNNRERDAAHQDKRDILPRNESTAMRSLGLSTMSSAQKNFYEWHIRDAFKLQ